ncbi:alpha/beta fold hydrolase [Streptomyces sp. NPDC048254]|uniref:alpha/beta fold hydrolase n=1 Tax=Streptomyces sp. NPDC048254 TaxID=3365525 RepID=UPI00371FEA97
MTAGLSAGRTLRGIAYAALGAVAPGAVSRWATDVFSDTRALRIRPDNLLPIGAARFSVENCPDSPSGYLWGERSAAGTALLVHGWASDSSSMHPLVGPMRDLGFTVAAFDAPAHGVRAGSQATMSQYADAVGAVLDTLGDVRVVVAHSLGTIAAIAAAAARGAPLDCLVLISPTCTLAGVLERWDGAGLRLSSATVDGIRRELHRRNGVPVTHWDAVGLGRSLECPVLAIHDPDDPMVPYTDAETVVAGLSEARLERAPGEGHLAILVSRHVRALVSAFVAEHTADRRGGRTRL